MKKNTSIMTLIILSVLTAFITSCSNENDEPKPEKLSSIEIKTPPIKTEYYIGENLDLSGLILTLGFENGDAYDIAFDDFQSNGITCSPENETEITKQTHVVLTHTSSNKTVNQTVNYMIVKDIENNEYQVVKIGEQLWMAENLKTTHYADGTEITLVEDSASWDALDYTEGAYCYYDNSINNGSIYGVLYNWEAAMNGAISSDSNPSKVQGACPDGWHIPSNPEWIELTDFLISEGFSSNQGTVLKSTDGWYGNGNGTDNYSFNSLPSGNRWSNGKYYALTINCAFWTTTEANELYAWFRGLYYDDVELSNNYIRKRNGFSIRCLKD